MAPFSSRLLRELHAAVDRALDREGLVNVPAIAWELMVCFPEESTSFAEMEAQVMAVGLARNAALLFHRPDALALDATAYADGGTTLH
jgi:hypothetical protein